MCYKIAKTPGVQWTSVTVKCRRNAGKQKVWSIPPLRDWPSAFKSSRVSFNHACLVARFLTCRVYFSEVAEAYQSSKRRSSSVTFSFTCTFWSWNTQKWQWRLTFVRVTSRLEIPTILKKTSKLERDTHSERQTDWDRQRYRERVKHDAKQNPQNQQIKQRQFLDKPNRDQLIQRTNKHTCICIHRFESLQSVTHTKPAPCHWETYCKSDWCYNQKFFRIDRYKGVS